MTTNSDSLLYCTKGPWKRMSEQGTRRGREIDRKGVILGGTPICGSHWPASQKCLAHQMCYRAVKKKTL